MKESISWSLIGGQSIGFTNALWTDFELVEQTERSDGVVEAHLLKRGAKSVDDLINNLKGHVSINHSRSTN